LKTTIKTTGLLAALAVGLTSPLFSQVPDLTKDTQSVDRQLAATPPQLKPPLHGLEEVGWQDERKPPFFPVLQSSPRLRQAGRSSHELSQRPSPQKQLPGNHKYEINC
jgi:hypothetical protein